MAQTISQTAQAGWKKNLTAPSLPEVHASIPVPKGKGFWRMLLAYGGPGLLVAVGYMDPGNWATDLAGGAQFGYLLISVILLSNLMAVLLQGLASRSEEHTSELQSRVDLVCRLLLEKKKN